MSNHIPPAARAVLQPDFVSLFQRLPQAAADVPGQVVLIGDHLESNGGFRLSMSLLQGTRIEVVLRDDRTVRVWSAESGREGVHREYRLGGEAPVRDVFDAVQAVTATLRHEGYEHQGFDARLTSSLPEAGLASRASRMVGLLQVLRELLHLDLTDDAVARFAYRAGTDFLGEPTGITQYLACASGKPGSAFLIDAARQQLEPVPLPVSVEWLVLPSGARQDHIAEFHQQRRRECEAACALLGLRWMRDLEGAGRQAVLASIEALPTPLDARARHIVMENERVLTALALLKSGNMDRFGAMLDASHESLRDDFDLSLSETDALVELSRDESSVYGARLACDGIGASLVMAVEAGAGAEVAAHLAERYREHHGSGVLLSSAAAA